MCIYVDIKKYVDIYHHETEWLRIEESILKLVLAILYIFHQIAALQKP